MKFLEMDILLIYLWRYLSARISISQKSIYLPKGYISPKTSLAVHTVDIKDCHKYMGTSQRRLLCYLYQVFHWSCKIILIDGKWQKKHRSELTTKSQNIFSNSWIVGMSIWILSFYEKDPTNKSWRKCTSRIKVQHSFTLFMVDPNLENYGSIMLLSNSNKNILELHLKY